MVFLIKLSVQLKHGLLCNETKTEFISTSTSSDTIHSLSGAPIKQVEDFVYLGSHIMESKKDFKSRKGMAWTACNKLDTIWNSDLQNSIEVSLFQATIEKILMYGSETWTLTSKQQQKTRRNIYKPTTTSTEHTLDTTRNIKRHIRKTA